ncbi:transcriptional regulator, TetR family [Mucilaginibacter pineti]|uniref:Transcriptional regulator, TetR family n=1 Tax=Mucilaginibacter pineti TaxID=1391627 RepID=A0A1G6ZB99_9SPHI|nr:TetR/AcrR family transcriptional regulator [Mucilaginibacter pineti]SDD99870.1 transcriptional regulator, TetR family [Mucilaginibacter pineti]
MRRRDILKEELVKQKAIETIVEHGLEGFTISKLAKACGISVGTPYVYYKDKDDLVTKIVLEEAERMEKVVNKDFAAELSLEDGLRIQWQNRFTFMMNNSLSVRFLDQVSQSSYHAKFSEMFLNENGTFLRQLKSNVEGFIRNAVGRGELDDMPFSVFWSIAYSPLYSLIRFHQQGYGLDGAPFAIEEKLLWLAFDKMIKGLKN